MVVFYHHTVFCSKDPFMEQTAFRRSHDKFVQYDVKSLAYDRLQQLIVV